MACERNRIIELEKYLLSLGINVNVGKNKARGHKGIFMHRFNDYRIDVSGTVPKEGILSVILHEFAHYIHYSYDKTLNSLSFIFNDYGDDIKEELIKITVQDISKEFASALFEKKANLNDEIKALVKQIREYCPDFKLTENNKNYESKISYPVKYLLKYDRVKFGGKLYSLDSLKEYKLSEELMLYLKIKSKQRAKKRINARITKLNKYYNNPSELFARFIDSYYTKPDYTQKIAPKSSLILSQSKIPYIQKLNYIFD